MDYWFACCCFQNPFMASNILRYHHRIHDDDCSESCGFPCLTACFGVSDCYRIAVIMKLLANTKIPEPKEDARYLLNSRIMNMNR